MDIAVLLTCHNRRAKTENCLRSLKDALAAYNNEAKEKVCVEIFLTDDGCTDGTAEMARGVFRDDNVMHILQGDGNLYWAGGMRFCWREAMKRHSEWNFYLLLNDDTVLISSLFLELFDTENYSMITYGQQAIVSGSCCSSKDHSVLTYGGHVFTNRFLGRDKHVRPDGKPVMCDTTNANVLLIPVSVVDKIGIFCKRYHHSYADYDYTFMARRKNIPVLLSANVCAICDNDHQHEYREKKSKLIGMTIAERFAYYRHPLHSMSDGLVYSWRLSPLKVPGTIVKDIMRLFSPTLYYKTRRFL